MMQSYFLGTFHRAFERGRRSHIHNSIFTLSPIKCNMHQIIVVNTPANNSPILKLDDQRMRKDENSRQCSVVKNSDPSLYLKLSSYNIFEISSSSVMPLLMSLARKLGDNLSKESSYGMPDG